MNFKKASLSNKVNYIVKYGFFKADDNTNLRQVVHQALGSVDYNSLQDILDDLYISLRAVGGTRSNKAIISHVVSPKQDYSITFVTPNNTDSDITDSDLVPRMFLDYQDAFLYWLQVS